MMRALTPEQWTHLGRTGESPPGSGPCVLCHRKTLCDYVCHLRTMVDGLLRFSKDGDTIVVTAPGGGTARLSGSETVASNGVLQPIDGVLAAPAPPPAAAN